MTEQTRTCASMRPLPSPPPYQNNHRLTTSLHCRLWCGHLLHSFVTTLYMLRDVFIRPLEEMAGAAESHVLNASPSSTGGHDAQAVGARDRDSVPHLTVTRDQIKTMFLEVESLILVNTELLRRLQERYGAWSPSQTIGDVFLSVLPFLKHFKTYANNFEAALATVASCKQQPAFRAFLTSVATNPCMCFFSAVVV